ncbi:MAG: MarR family winged helix-turn-helix transcriptional regulator [Acidimicrobiia bacterium]
MDPVTLPTPLRRTASNLAAARAEQVLTRWARQFHHAENDTGLSVERIELLAHLERNPYTDLGPGDLAEALSVSRPAVTRTVNNLEGSGLVRRVGSTADGRSVVVRLTPAGRRAVNRARANRVRTMASRLRGRSERELIQLAQGLRILAEMLDED